MMMVEESFNQGVIFEQKPNILLFSLDQSISALSLIPSL